MIVDLKDFDLYGYMKEHGFSQRGIAKKTGIERKNVWKICQDSQVFSLKDHGARTSTFYRILDIMDLKLVVMDEDTLKKLRKDYL